MTERVFKVGDKVLWKITGKVYNVVANNTVRAVGRGSFSEGFLNSLADKSQYTITEGEEIMEHKFKKGDKVRVTSVDRNDEEDGIYIGCRGVIDEDDTAPYVLFPDARRAMMESQLELVENSADEEESGWIKWNGGECPVAADVIVQCMMRGGEDVGFWHMAELKGGEWDWSHTNHPGDIVSYRVVEEAKEEFTPGTTTVDVGSPVQEDSGSAAKPIKSDGGSSEYYKIAVKTSHGMADVEVNDLIYALVGGDFDLGNVLKAARRMYLASKGCGKEGVDIAYDVNKCKWFLDDFQMRFGKE